RVLMYDVLRVGIRLLLLYRLLPIPVGELPRRASPQIQQHCSSKHPFISHEFRVELVGKRLEITRVAISVEKILHLLTSGKFAAGIGIFFA
ncbi:hypothetical protein PMAYCL1PPCAC_04209, partial [Pristionchus mayeri]